ncbi:protein rapunzel-like [Triplophysa rosa]|uniref:protein rapunzel-like n=1 Tax=Triplophysa rosa TaxID=992332 RepID=UPI0025462153|nr:protein rapunzel-like [Triplophysa rosa]
MAVSLCLFFLSSNKIFEKVESTIMFIIKGFFFFRSVLSLIHLSPDTMGDNKIDQEKVKKVFKKVLQFAAAISSAAGAFNPIFNVASPIIQVVLHHVDDEDLMKNLKCEFKNMNQTLDVISKQNHQILLDIKKREVDNQYTEIERNLGNQFRSYMEMVEAKPECLQLKMDEFIERYEINKDDENMNNLYEGVVGIRKLFSRPVLEVYLECAQGDKQVMKDLCTHLASLFRIGYITMMSYYAFKNDDLELRNKEWQEKMKKLQGVMGEWM